MTACHQVFRPRLLWLVCCCGLLLSAVGERPVAAEEATSAVDYGRDIRPVLSDKCYACHGPDAKRREAGLRLDQKDHVLKEAESGEIPVVPGKPQNSELLRRLLSEDQFERMPPQDSQKSVTPEEIEKIRAWIQQGAPWQEHWAFIAPKRSESPAVKNSQWSRSPIDHFILARLEREGLSPSSEADKTTLIRRVTFDLTGLPPTVAEVDAFLADGSPDAYEKVVNRLLDSPKYGEHMARFWLDAARYGDTHGLHLDNYREMWPYRDWVVRAMNNNMPFDRFVTEQLAGDLLEDPTLDQLIASGFNRCHVTTAEGGSIKEEVYVRNVVDRVVTTGAVFLGLTLDCTRCHDHKYDPLTMKDFYSVFAFFNSLQGDPMDGNKKDHAPVIRVMLPSQEQEVEQGEKEIEQLRAEIKARLADYKYVEPPADQTAPPEPQEHEVVWIDDDVPAGATAEGGWQFVSKPKPVFSGQKASTRTASGLSQHFFHGASKPLRLAEGDRLFAHVYIDPNNPPKEIMLQWNDGTWEHRAYWGGNNIPWGTDASPSRRRIGDLPEADKWVRLEVPAAQVGLAPGTHLNGWAFTQFDGTVYWDAAGIVTSDPEQGGENSLAAWQQRKRKAKKAALPEPILKIVRQDTAKRSPQDQKQLEDYFVEHVWSETRDVFKPLHDKIDKIQLRTDILKKGAATTLVFREQAKPKPSYILHRGEYDQQRDQVGRATPAVLPPMPSGAPLNRLGFAQWLVDPGHPLTARVTVNRFWQQVFGVGLVKTAEDFGSQGDVPSHPKLLDWLAVQFVEDGWDVKQTMKRIVMSATYRQSSRTNPELIRRDPQNRLLARGPRFRLDAEMLRDQALAVSGLLLDKMGGPSVKPPQPDGIWFSVGYTRSNTARFKADTGPDKVHRRTLYTFVKRTAPPPQMSTFDGPSRESCSVRRERTNTPLQALLLMNDPQFVEAARALAARTMIDGGDSPESRARFMFRLSTAREPRSAETAELIGALKDHLATYENDPEAAKGLLGVGEFKTDAQLDVTQWAAWTMIANLVLNLDEVLNKN